MLHENLKFNITRSRFKQIFAKKAKNFAFFGSERNAKKVKNSAKILFREKNFSLRWKPGLKLRFQLK